MAIKSNKKQSHYKEDTVDLMKSPNMNYRYNVEYFKNISKDDKKGKYTLVSDSTLINKWNDQILKFKFKKCQEYLRDVTQKSSFSLVTSYPGLLIGIGNEHGINADAAFKVGFTFDYVTGVPYIPGSSIKGLIRSYFPDIPDEKFTDLVEKEKNEGLEQFIKCCLEKEFPEEVTIQQLEENIFDNNDIFLGAYPIIEREQSLIAEEYITPHKQELKNPIPISLIKVKPGVRFEFYFILNDFEKDGRKIISKEEKLTLFKNIILNCGAGAKTNVGFGRFKE